MSIPLQANPGDFLTTLMSQIFTGLLCQGVALELGETLEAEIHIAYIEREREGVGRSRREGGRERLV